ncbi:MAG: sigma-70 family RNA polymerase sigma factor [Pirellulaceae bacterium]|jgi:RNA polymerase sigma-70 factor (ECF subfamily)|nr:sigma-70 family RNA polymerase sigma factor [Pirellulaceae bacterium]HJN10597.1 sigma-70 family RNA polymerase sigma factor [Pirellulaceae bacterium]
MPGAEEQDVEILSQLKAGDEQTLAKAFSRHRERLWQMVRFRLDQRLARRVDENDILQEAYLDAARRLRHFEDHGDSSVFVWLRMIVGQTLVDVHRRHFGARKRSVVREIPIHDRFNPQATSVSIAGQLLGRLTSPSQAAIRAELSSQVEAALASMDPIDQEVLALRHFEELTNTEVAEVLGIQQKAASIRYVRALKRLKGIFAKLSDVCEE